MSVTVFVHGKVVRLWLRFASFDYKLLNSSNFYPNCLCRWRLSRKISFQQCCFFKLWAVISEISYSCIQYGKSIIKWFLEIYKFVHRLLFFLFRKYQHFKTHKKLRICMFDRESKNILIFKKIVIKMMSFLGLFKLPEIMSLVQKYKRYRFGRSVVTVLWKD